MDLFSFQKKAIKKMLKCTLIDKTKLITLKSPTGSGKTIMLSKYIDAFCDIVENGIDAPVLQELNFSEEEINQFDFDEIKKEYDKNEFVWLSPSTGGLTEQSKGSFDDNISLSILYFI